VDVFAEVLSAKAAGTRTKIDDLLVPLVRKSLKIFVAAVGIIYIAESLSIEILPLLTGLGIGGLAVAFAAKDTIENFFGSIAVIVDRPFEVGDWVVIDGDVEGTVEELGFRSTRVRTFYNSLVTVPNASLVRANVDNYGRRKYRRYSTKLGLAYDTPAEKIDAFCEGVRELIRQHPYTRKDYYQVYFNDYGESSLQMLVYIFFEAPDWSVELRERHRFLNDVLRLAAKLGVEFAYPTQTLYLKRGGESPAGDAPDFEEIEDAARESEVVGRKLARSLTRKADWRTERPGPVEFKGAAPVEHDPEADEPDSQIEQRTAGG
jgi:MscS family membrane protein